MAERGDIEGYDYRAIEAKWQKAWEEAASFKAPERPDPSTKYYVLEMFPYPSGNLHMGHVRNYAIGDLIARYQRLRGRQVLHPMGWDALGLPAENAAIKDGVHPSIRTEQNVRNVRRQFKALGMSYDWDREIGTWKPEYYRWNQWFFLKFLERDLIYRRESEVNWCPTDETVLANEQVVDGLCWRCDTVVVKKAMPEWAFRITAYAQALLDGLDELVEGGWPDRVTTMQRNWIGKSVGLECDFPIDPPLVGPSASRRAPNSSLGSASLLDPPLVGPSASRRAPNSSLGSASLLDDSGEAIRIFTTRGDTIFGATYMVLAPEHPMVGGITHPERKSDVEAFVARMKATDKIVRTAADTAKEGVDTGAKAVNPFTGEKIPVWIANFVLAEYGTGAVMSVPAHDQRDFEFAKKYGLPIRVVIAPTEGEAPEADTLEKAFTEDGVLVSSGEFSGVPSEKAREKIASMAERGEAPGRGGVAGPGFGRPAVKWHLRDWGFSRQRYWGTPIPVVYCEKDGTVPLREQDLPVLLPPDAPLGKGGGPPLSKVPEFVQTTCWKCGGPARREVETMDTFVDSAWYFARFLDPKNDGAPFRRELADAWLPVDIYIGGPEHAVLHLLYFRFWTMVMKDLGLVSHGEPARKLLTQGIVYKDGAKMSKSKGNVVSPDDMIEKYGADTARVFSLFAAPPEKDLEWDDRSVEGAYRFLKRVWTMLQQSLPLIVDAPALDPAVLAKEAPGAHALWRKAHDTVRRVTQAIGENFHYNVGVAAMMELANEVQALPEAEKVRPQAKAALRFSLERMALVLSPYAPHLGEEMWERLGHAGGVVKAGWPEWDPEALKTDTVTLVVQVNGKVRSNIEVGADADQSAAEAVARADEKVKPWLEGKSVAKVIFVKKNHLLNFVVKG